MRYKINIDKIINQLVHFSIRGRKLILFIQGIMQPLQSVNDWFVDFAREKKIEANMTSQIMPFEWFLNYKLSKYFVNKNDKITIVDKASLGLPVYRRPNTNTIIVWGKDAQGKDHPVSHLKDEEENFYVHSFEVSCPEIIEKHSDDFLNALVYWVDRYKVAGKSYIVSQIKNK